MSKRKIISSSSEEESVVGEDGEGQYLVEVITAAKVNDEREVEYLVKWFGYTSDDDSWEPQENVKECTRLLRNFWTEVGIDKRKNPGPPGSEYNASESWIVGEREFFKSEMKQERQREKERKRLKTEEKERRRREKNRQKQELERKQQLKRTPKVKLTIKDDAQPRARPINLELSKELFNSDMEDTSDEPLSAKIKPAKDKGKGKEIPKVDRSRPELAPLKDPKTFKAPTSTTQSSIAPKNKYAGLKIPKKPVPTAPITVGPSTQPAARLRDGPAINTSESRLPAFNRGPPSPSQGSYNFADSTSPILTNFAPSRAPPDPPSRRQSVTEDDVHNILATVAPLSAVIAQKPGKTQVSEEKVPQASSHLRFEKRWRWSGELFLDTTGAAERLCEIAITDTYDVSPIGFKLNVILESRDSLRLSKVYNKFEMDTILRSLKRVDQIARISPQKEVDNEIVETLVRYLSREGLTIASPVITNYGHVAQMVIFPASATDLCTRLNIPAIYRDNNSLLLVLMPWAVPPSRYNERSYKPDEIRDPSLNEDYASLIDTFPPLQHTPSLEVSLRILKFSETFLKFVIGRPYCIWASPVEAIPKDHGREFSGALRMDTIALLTVLRALGCKNVGYKADVRVVFIHVGAVRTIGRLPALMERRCKRPEIQFVTYGSHECVKPSLWGFHEIFPLGGIVTFTPTAILENPYGIADIIEQIHKHPLWECYILPSVLAIFIRWSCPSEDPLTIYDREPSRFGKTLKLIDEGKVALMRSPGLEEQAKPGNELEESNQWIATQFSMLGKTSRDLTEDCWSAYIAEYSNKTEPEILTAIEADIVKDLSLLQVQPVIRSNYRRFVVIAGMQENIEVDKNGFEWRTVQDFSFRDNYGKLPGAEAPKERT